MISSPSTRSPWHWKRKCPGSMIPACTGPTATSWTSSPSTTKNGYSPGMVARGSLRPKASGAARSGGEDDAAPGLAPEEGGEAAAGAERGEDGRAEALHGEDRDRALGHH